MNLNLTRPLVFFDIEATGLNTATDRIVELCLIKVFPDGHEEPMTMRFNPGIPISPEASAITGISNADVASCPPFREKAAEIADFLSGCDLAGYNSNAFDVPMLVEEFIRAGINYDISAVRMIDVQTIFYKQEPRTLTAAYKFYCGGDLTEAHSALADTRATFEVLKAQLERYKETVENDVAFLEQYTRRNRNYDLAGRIVLDDEDKPVVNFGKYKGQRVADVFRRDPSYFDWLMRSDFPQNTKQAFLRIKLDMN